MSVTLESPDWDALIQRINDLDARMRKSALTRSLNAGAEVVAQAIGKRAPRSAVSRPPGGKTQTWRTGRHAADNVLRGKPVVREFEASVKVGWDAKANDPHFYMKFMEYGTSSVAGKPFMEYALADSEEAALTAMAEQLRSEFDG